MSIKTSTARIERDDYDVGRHWSPQSEKYSTADALMTALDNGWRVQGVVFRQEHWYDSARRASVYHVRLHRDSSAFTMIVIDSPYIARLLDNLGVQVVQQNQRKQTASLERW